MHKLLDVRVEEHHGSKERHFCRAYVAHTKIVVIRVKVPDWILTGDLTIANGGAVIHVPTFSSEIG